MKSRGKSTKIDWQVSGRRYAVSPSGPIPTLNIILNLRVFSNSPLHLGHFTFFSEIVLSKSSSSALSGISILIVSAINLSALNVDLQFLHLIIGSAKLAKCPDASNTDGDIICEPSISSILSRLTSSRLQSSRNLFFRFTPEGPYSQNPACASAYISQLGK